MDYKYISELLNSSNKDERYNKFKKSIDEIAQPYINDYELFWKSLAPDDKVVTHDHPKTEEEYREFWNWLISYLNNGEHLIMDLCDKADGEKFGLYDMIHFVKFKNQILTNP